jgi:hypothetical protein
VRSLSLSGSQLNFLLCFAGTNRPSTMLGRQRRRITPTRSLSTRAAGLRVANFARTSPASLPTSNGFTMISSVSRRMAAMALCTSG